MSLLCITYVQDRFTKQIWKRLDRVVKISISIWLPYKTPYELIVQNCRFCVL